VASDEKPAMIEAFLKGLGIEKGVIIGTDSQGRTKTIFMKPTAHDMAMYTKVLDNQIFKMFEQGEKNDIRNKRSDGVGEVDSSGDSGQ